MRKLIATSLFVSAILALSSASVESVKAQGDGNTGKYAAVNGLNLYYEVHGSGQPLLLLHGGLGGIVEFSQVLPELAKTRQVIAVEMQGHGRTADIDRAFSYEALADDVAALIRHLGLEQADVLGYSLGGGVALQLAIQHPQLVHKMVLISTVFKLDGWFPENLQGMAAMNAEAAPFMMQTPMYQFYASVAPQPENWPTLLDKLGNFLSTPYDWSAAVAKIKTPTLIIAGDADAVRPSHTLELFTLLGGGQAPGAWDSDGSQQTPQFALLPGTTHYNILSRANLIVPLVLPFLDAPIPVSK